MVCPLQVELFDKHLSQSRHLLQVTLLSVRERLFTILFTSISVYSAVVYCILLQREFCRNACVYVMYLFELWPAAREILWKRLKLGCVVDQRGYNLPVSSLIYLINCSNYITFNLHWFVTVPLKVGNVRVTGVGTDYASLIWDQGRGLSVENYEVRYWSMDGKQNTSSVFSISTNFTLVNLAQQTKYMIMVSSANTVMWSDVRHCFAL